MARRKKLKNLSEIRRFFHRNEDPIYFVSATNFNLLGIDDWCQMVVKHTDDTIDVLTDAPPSGIWRMCEDGSVEYDRFDYHRRAVESEREAFFLRILKPGDYRYEGADLGILVTRGRAMTDKFALTERSKKWIAGMRRHFKSRALTEAAPPELSEHQFKLL